MIFVDYLLLAVVAISTVVSIFRGFFREALSLVGWVIAVWGAWRYGAMVAPGLESWIETPLLRLWAARAIILVTVLIIAGLIAWLISLLLNQTGLTGTDRSIGMVFGFARGAILAALLVMLMEFAGFNESAWWQDSKLIPYAAPMVSLLREAADKGFEYLDPDSAGAATGLDSFLK